MNRWEYIFAQPEDIITKFPGGNIWCSKIPIRISLFLWDTSSSRVSYDEIEIFPCFNIFLYPIQHTLYSHEWIFFALFMFLQKIFQKIKLSRKSLQEKEKRGIRNLFSLEALVFYWWYLFSMNIREIHRIYCKNFCITLYLGLYGILSVLFYS